MDEPLACDMCTDLLDATDLGMERCPCGYRTICLLCYARLKDTAAENNLPAKCPNCRTDYDERNFVMKAIDPQQLLYSHEGKKKGKVDKRTGVREKTLPLSKSKKDLANVRVLQKNLVYAVGLALDICHEDVLRDTQYFGQFGKIVKISVNRAGPHASGTKNGTGSAYITFKRSSDAEKCIKAVDGITWLGRTVKLCFGTTKYCNAFLKGLPCNNPDCLYLHDVADEDVSFTKEEMNHIGPAKFATLAHSQSLTNGKPCTQGLVGSLGGQDDEGPSEPIPIGAHAPAAAAEAAAARLQHQDATAAAARGPGVWGSPGPAPSQLAASNGSAGRSGWLSAVAGGNGPLVQPATAAPVSDSDWPELTTAASGALCEDGASGTAAAAAAAAAAPAKCAAAAVASARPVAPAAVAAPPLVAAGTTMAAQIARAASGGVGAAGKAKKDEGGKKLTPISPAGGKARAAKLVTPPSRLAPHSAASTGAATGTGQPADEAAERAGVEQENQQHQQQEKQQGEQAAAHVEARAVQPKVAVSGEATAAAAAESQGMAAQQQQRAAMQGTAGAQQQDVQRATTPPAGSLGPAAGSSEALAGGAATTTSAAAAVAAPAAAGGKPLRSPPGFAPPGFAPPGFEVVATPAKELPAPPGFGKPSVKPSAKGPPPGFETFAAAGAGTTTSLAAPPALPQSMGSMCSADGSTHAASTASHHTAPVGGGSGGAINSSGANGSSHAGRGAAGPPFNPSLRSVDSTSSVGSDVWSSALGIAQGDQIVGAPRASRQRSRWSFARETAPDSGDGIGAAPPGPPPGTSAPAPAAAPAATQAPLGPPPSSQQQQQQQPAANPLQQLQGLNLGQQQHVAAAVAAAAAGNGGGGTGVSDPQAFFRSLLGPNVSVQVQQQQHLHAQQHQHQQQVQALGGMGTLAGHLPQQGLQQQDAGMALLRQLQNGGPAGPLPPRHPQAALAHLFQQQQQAVAQQAQQAAQQAAAQQQLQQQQLAQLQQQLGLMAQARAADAAAAAAQGGGGGYLDPAIMAAQPRAGFPQHQQGQQQGQVGAAYFEHLRQQHQQQHQQVLGGFPQGFGQQQQHLQGGAAAGGWPGMGGGVQHPGTSVMGGAGQVHHHHLYGQPGASELQDLLLQQQLGAGRAQQQQQPDRRTFNNAIM